MNAENAKDYLPLLQALADGKTIQYKNPYKNEWEETKNLYASVPVSHYRIKPEPREWTASVVTQKVQEGAYCIKDIGSLVAHDRSDADDGYEIVRVREILD